MNLDHVNAFTAAMARKDIDAMFSHMADDIVLKTPLAAGAFKGKAAIRPVVEALLAVVDKFEFREILQGPEHVAAFFGITVGTTDLDGVDFWKLSDSGTIQEMTVLWRPLPAIIAVSERLG
jgi:ketosteroid isomerase-like protein